MRTPEPVIGFVLIWQRLPRLIQDALLLVAAAGLAFLIWKGQTQQEATFKRADRAACVRIEKLKKVARTQLQRGLTTLPTLSYYKEHPDELAAAKQQIHKQLRDFQSIDCN